MNNLVEEKLDEILSILKKDRISIDGKEKLKEEICTYMLKHFNISWLDDTIEKNVYESLLGVLLEIIEKYIPI